MIFYRIMQKTITLIFLLLVVQLSSPGQKSSLIVLGDLHYDRIEVHDMNWLKEKPDDLRQVKEYTDITRKNWDDFMTVLRTKALTVKPPVRALIQLGDLSEGLAGSEEKADQMASDIVKAVEAANIPVPWVIAKGNHDITGPGAGEAFLKHYVPLFRRQTGNPGIQNANYTYRFDNVQITCIDPWNRSTDMVQFLEKELSSSDAKFKFIAVHEPVIPVTERCWHTLRRDPAQREKLLGVIAKNKAIVLCAHLHRYSVVRRSTDNGPIVQVMAVSVVSDRDYLKPDKLITEYGPSLAVDVPEWEPNTLEARKAMLAEEARYVTFYKQTDLPGYAVIKLDERKGTVKLEYYPAFGKKAYDKVNLTRLLEK